MQSQTRVTLEAYERWAPTYTPDAHNPLMRAEQGAMAALWPDVSGRRALDLACGSGRYVKLLAQGGARDLTAVDFSWAMLTRVSGCRRVQASMTRLPFAPAVFDVVVSGLAVGHAASIQQWMSEVGRVLDHGGVLLYSDFHPEAARAGLPRSFNDEQGKRHVVPHNSFAVDEQVEAAASAGLEVETVRELRAGMEINEPFAGSESFYRQRHGLPLVLVVRARKP
jgi:malonyl-CoA O-methyltransferase